MNQVVALKKQMPNKLWALALLVAVALAVTFIVLYATADTSGGGG